MLGALCSGDISGAKKLIKEFEGFSHTVYFCPAGKPTIGYGFVVNKDHPPMTEAEAEVILDKKLKDFSVGVWKLIQKRKNFVSDNEFNALISFAYNVGLANLQNSTLLKRFLAGYIDEAADEFLKWRMAAGKPSRGLQRRREAEKRLFLSP